MFLRLSDKRMQSKLTNLLAKAGSIVRRVSWVSVLAFVSIAISLPTRPAQADSTALVTRPPWTASRVQGSPDTPAPYQVVPAFPRLQFRRPTFAQQVPGAERLIVGELYGKILSFPKDPTTSQADAVIDLIECVSEELRAQVAAESSSLFLFDMAFHPRFLSNHYVFLCYVHPGEQPRIRVSRFTMSPGDPPQILPTSERVLIRWPFGGHNGGCLRFGPDGFLYISTGDHSPPNTPDINNVGQDTGNLFASILRIDVDREDSSKHYSIPADNPFQGHPSARPEVWAYGLRNTWRMAFDASTGDLWAADVGWETWEMIHLVKPGGNYGWSIVEGRKPMRSDVAPGPTPIIPPVKDYPRSEAGSVTGGVVYAGARLPKLTGSFVYGDYVTGKVWASRREGDAYSHRELASSPLHIVAFAEGHSGELYVVDHGIEIGQLYELIPNEAPRQEQPFPRKLSQTGLFTSVKSLEPAAGVIPYSINAEPWMDGGHARRWVGLPGSSSIEIGKSSQPKFPEGTVLVKTILLDSAPRSQPRRVETQLLHLEAATWRPYTYAWNEAQDDALLVDAKGLNRVLHLPAPGSEPGGREQTWRFASRSECLRCHKTPVGPVLGFDLRQLAGDPTSGETHKNQLQALRETGVLGGPAPREYRSTLTDPHDTSADLDKRARSYLHVNCSVCHNHGVDPTNELFFPHQLSLDETGTLEEPSVGAFGISDARILTPGDPLGSTLLYRLAKLGYARMPRVGSRVVDARGLTLIHDWIATLGKETGPRKPQLNRREAASIRRLTARDTLPSEERDRTIHELLRTTRGALALVVQIHQGALKGSIRQRAIDLGAESSSPNIRGLFETFVPESQRRVVLGPHPLPELILEHKGDRARGEQIYFSEATPCKNCHAIGAQGESLGPNLKESLTKYSERPELLSHILDPSAKIAPEYSQYVLVTQAGQAHTGLLVEKTATTLVLKNTDKELIRVDAEDVVLLEKQQKSLMPDLLLRDMTAQEVADLLTFLLSIRSEN